MRYLLLLLAFAAGCARAEGLNLPPETWGKDWTRDKWNVGASLGSAKMSIVDFEIPGTTPVSIPSATVTANKLFIGYRQSLYFGAEIGTLNVGKMAAERNSTIPSERTDKVVVNTNGIFFDALIFTPCSERFSVFAKIGEIYIKTDADLLTKIEPVPTVSPLVITSSRISQHGWRQKYGIGTEWTLSQSKALRLEYELLRNVKNPNVGSSNMSIISAGFVLSF